MYFPLKCHFLQIFKIILESSHIAHSIGNFILKNFNSEHFLIKLISDEIWLYIHMTSCDVIQFCVIVYLIRYQFYQKMFRIKVFQYKISDRMSYLGALYDNFETFRKKFSMGKNFRKSRGSSRNFNRFSIWKRFWTHKR